MSPLPPPAPPAHVQAQAALAEVLGSYLGQHGVAPEPALLRQLLQEAPVLELLHWLDATALRLAPPLAAALASTPPPAPSATAEAQIAAVPGQGGQSQVESITLARDAPVGPVSASGAVDALFVAPATTAPTATALRWRFANATAGTPYRAQATPVSDPQRPQLQYRLMAVDGLQGSGLRFDAADGVLSGVPSTAAATGEEMHFVARFVPVDAAGGAPVHAGVASLLVNPDPRALWKQREPDAALGLRKPHTATAHAQIAGAQVVAASVRGRSHANAASFREDDFAIATDQDARWLVCAVADGAGSAPLSRRGSELLTRHAVTTLAAHMDGIECWARSQALQWPQHAEVLPRVQPRLLQAVCASLVSASQALVQHATLLGVDESALASTLMLTAVRPCGEQLLVLSYWIGDGAAAAYDAATGQVQLLGHADAGEYSGQTRFFLSDALAGDPQAAVQGRLRCVRLPAGAKVILMSDGVSDPKFGTERALQDPVQWQHWWQTDIAPPLSAVQDIAALPEVLVDYLGFWYPGEHDDRTLLMIQTERAP